VDNFLDVVVQLSGFSQVQKKRGRAKKPKVLFSLFITSRIFSGILAIGSAMQHRQKQ
jgi:hypothetical protein